MKVAALDIGGAHIKACAADGRSFTRPFELWREPAGLAAELRDSLARLGPCERLAVTLTGEICDCYASKREGVASILHAVERALAGAPPGILPGREAVRVWRNDGRFATLAEAEADPLPAAGANWLPLASFAGAFAERGAALLIDVGSTTTDIVPLLDGKPRPEGRTDTERLLAGELLYRGASRTPVAAVVRALPYRGASCPVASELFATVRDAYLVLGLLEEDALDTRTADQRPATRAHAVVRLARMVGADAETFGEDDARAASSRVFSEEREAIRTALRRVAARVAARAGAPLSTIVLSGSGEFLGRAAAEGSGARLVSLRAEIGPEGSAAATACALRHVALAMIE